MILEEERQLLQRNNHKIHEETNKPTALETKVMKVKLSDAEFPYYDTQMEKK